MNSRQDPLSCSLRQRRWRKVLTRCRKLARADGGVAAMEFVILAPVFLLLILGFTELYMYMRAVSAMEHTAFVVADTLGQATSVTDTTSTSATYNLGTMWLAATNVASPLNLQSNGAVVITSICDSSTTCQSGQGAGVTTKGTPSLMWQRAAPWNQSSMTTKETSASLLPSKWPFYTGDAAVVVEVFYKYSPFMMTSFFWQGAPGAQTLYERVYVRTRSGNPLVLNAS